MAGGPPRPTPPFVFFCRPLVGVVFNRGNVSKLCDHNEGVPGYFFSKEAEATSDHSLEALCRDRCILPA